MSVDPRPLLATSSEVRVRTSPRSGEECFLCILMCSYIYLNWVAVADQVQKDVSMKDPAARCVTLSTQSLFHLAYRDA